MKIKDRFALGVIAGMLSYIPRGILNNLEYKYGLIDNTYSQGSATLFISKKDTNTLHGKIIGFINNSTLIGITGVTTSYLLSITGRDHKVLKGVGISSISALVLGGILTKMGIVAKPKKLNTYTLGHLDHILYGALCGLIVAKLGDDSLFPDYKITEGEKLPVVNTAGINQSEDLD